nr:MAG TPA: hypothetical protein [Caudoviricetes sp.]
MCQIYNITARETVLFLFLLMGWQYVTPLF